MKENKDRHQVVIAREMYDDLMFLATIGNHERHGNGKTVANIRRHAQKYNKHLHEERQVVVAKEAAEFRRLRSKVIAMIVTHALTATQGGMTVWRKCMAPSHPGLSERPIFYLGCKVVGRSEAGKLFVKVRNIESHELYDVHIEALLTELPEGYTYEEKGLSKNIAYDARVMTPRQPYEIRRSN